MHSCPCESSVSQYFSNSYIQISVDHVHFGYTGAPTFSFLQITNISVQKIYILLSSAYVLASWRFLCSSSIAALYLRLRIYSNSSKFPIFYRDFRSVCLVPCPSIGLCLEKSHPLWVYRKLLNTDHQELVVDKVVTTVRTHLFLSVPLTSPSLSPSPPPTLPGGPSWTLQRNKSFVNEF